MKPLVSIIIPVYNAGHYLRRSVEAVLNQTYSNIELLLINDGSTDDSKSICLEYANKDSKVKYYEHANHGQGFTRARGVQLASGDLVAFVDQDDYMAPHMYEIMVNAIAESGVDVCVCQWNYELPDGRHTINNRVYEDSFYGVKEGVEFARYLYWYRGVEKGGSGYANGVVVSPWNKLFRRKLLIGFESTGYLGEDEEMNDYVLSQPGVKVNVIPDELYYWCENLGSMSNRPFSDKRWYFLRAMGKRIKKYNDTYILTETCKLICNLYIEYFYKGKIAKIIPPCDVAELYSDSCLNLIKLGYNNPSFYARMFLFKCSPFLYKRLLMR